VPVAALGIDGNGDKLVEGATENAAVVQALIDNLIAASSTPSYAAQRAFVR
jgi:putative transposase